MNQRSRFHSTALRAPTSAIAPRGWLAALFGLVFAAMACAQGTSIIEGRVLNPASGAFLEGARITVEGTQLESFTDSDGNFRLAGVPAGVARVRVFFTGFRPYAGDVRVAAGEVTRHDVSLTPMHLKEEALAEPGLVKLDPFQVNASREITGTAYAINEQRFAPNIKNVVSTDEFGNVAEGNVGEFLKFLPGLQINYDSGFASTVSLNGAPADNVPVTLDGFDVASAGSGNSTARAVELTMMSVNNLSRIEVTYSPTPESKGSALAGGVNMVPRSSFERARPVFNYSAAVMMRDDRVTLDKTPGPYRTPVRKIYPGFDFTYIAPVNKRFGFTLSGGTNKQFSAEPISYTVWRGRDATTNGTTFPHTTPDQPYLSSYRVRDGGRENNRASFGGTVDWKMTDYDRVSLSLQYTYNAMVSNIHTINFNPNAIVPGGFSLTSVRGVAGAGSLDLNVFARDMANSIYMPSLRWRHDGPVWRAEGGAGMSHAQNRDRDVDKGFFQSVSARRTGLTISFDDIFYLRPRVITVTDNAGQPVDPFDLNNYALTSGNSNQTDSADLKRSAFVSLARDFNTRIPFTLKGGLDMNQSVRELRGTNDPSFNYVGADGRTSTSPLSGDDAAGPFVNASWLGSPGAWGFPKVPAIDQWSVYEVYRDHPNYLQPNENTRYRQETNRSKHAEELISSAYLRADAAFFERRLKLVGGIRAEQTNVKGEGPLTDPTRNLQRDANGNVIRGPNGQPLPITSDSAAASKLTFLERAAKADKEYLRLFPNINASYSLRENLIARASYYYSVGRPNFNQYAGGTTLPNLELEPSSSNRISVANAGIKAWSAKSTQLRLEYYFEGVGQISVNAFRRDIENFFGSYVTRATPEFLELYGLDPEVYGIYDVATQYNLPGIVRVEGTNVDYKQALTFLPHWARGIQVFGNVSAQRATGLASDNFAGYVPRTASWGFSLTREKFNYRMNWNYRGRNRRGPVASGASIEPGTYNWGSKYLFLDILGEYHFRRNFSFYFNLRNVTDSPEDFEIAGPSTPAIAQFRSRIDYAALWTFGVKGSF